jgi:hypothetical protein
MSHIAIQEKQDGKVVDWMEHVTDEQSMGDVSDVAERKEPCLPSSPYA